MWRGAWAKNPGAVVNVRVRALDAIPFNASFDYDMEIWHWKDCRIDYRAVSWCYLLPAR